MSEVLMYVRRCIRGVQRLVAVCRLLNFPRTGVLGLGLGTYGRVGLQLHTLARYTCVWDKAEEQYDVPR
jgi:hypothetical protein